MICITVINTVHSSCSNKSNQRSKATLRLMVSQYVLVSSTPVGLATRYYFLYEGFWLKVAVLSMWGALSDERMCFAVCNNHSMVRVAQNP
jgi:hypothetical protein